MPSISLPKGGKGRGSISSLKRRGEWPTDLTGDGIEIIQKLGQLVLEMENIEVQVEHGEPRELLGQGEDLFPGLEQVYFDRQLRDVREQGLDFVIGADGIDSAVEQGQARQAGHVHDFLPNFRKAHEFDFPVETVRLDQRVVVQLGLDFFAGVWR